MIEKFMSWKANVKVNAVDEIGCWKLGANYSRNILTQDNLFTNEECNFTCLATLPNVDMLRPCGRLIGL